MSRLSGNKVGEDVCKALGLDASNVFSIHILIDVQSAATVEVGRYLESDKVGELIKVLEKYEITKVKNDT